MEWLLFTIYFLGWYMNLHLSRNILAEKGREDDFLISHMVVGSLFWPFASAFYFAKMILTSFKK